MKKSIEERFWSKVNKSIFPDKCWEWTGSKRLGYGRFKVGVKKVSAHRFAYMLLYGNIPKGKVIMHICDNKSCVNLSHLKLGTQKQNMQDAANKKRIYNQVKTHCAKGHAYAGDNLIIIETASGGIGRQCRKCNNIAAIKSYKKHKAKRNIAFKKWVANNKEHRRLYKKAYNLKQKEK